MVKDKEDSKAMFLSELFGTGDSYIPFRGNKYPLDLSIEAELWLEREGISITNLAENVQKSFQETYLKIAFAAFPKEEYRCKITFDKFIEGLTKEERAEIVQRIDIFVSAFFKAVLRAKERIKDSENQEAGKKKQ